MCERRRTQRSLDIEKHRGRFRRQTRNDTKMKLPGKGIGRFSKLQNYWTFIDSPANNTPLFSLPRPPPPSLLHLSLHRWTPPRASEGQSAHVFSVGPGNSDATVRTLFRVSAVNRPVASAPSKRRLSQNPHGFIPTPEIAPSALTLS